MEFELKEKTEDRIEFNVSGIDNSIANALRKIIISEVPVLAIEDVTYYQNTSVMNDEVLGHRLGLIPLKTDLAGPEAVTITLKTSGPGTIYAKELKVAETDVKGSDLESEPIAVYEKMPVIKLTEHQSIEMEANAVVGKGKEHIKWQAGTASYEAKEDGSFDFFVESYGQLPVEDLLMKAFGIFEEKLKGVKKAL